jgi:hypothetical protein
LILIEKLLGFGGRERGYAMGVGDRWVCDVALYTLVEFMLGSDGLMNTTVFGGGIEMLYCWLV